ncbi:polyphosphate kinase 2 [Brevundimonas sp.]|uniref:polyphosphate kinase 2 n=1 Tax=Brevundimonas sp. TaxID=1871086 RepID=UPI001D853FEC|nr:polyphosphate kinase 2 [Brevundimonas sp.]MBL0948764.1 polyphosphate kinase 2 [Brevundimonas sp.]
MGKKNEAYEAELRTLQIALVESQARLIAEGRKVLILFEGRDTAGKDGAIKRVTEHMAPRHTRVVSLPKPSDREQTQWYFQRYVAHLPAAGEIVIFNRSWYNRAGVEVVMGFSTAGEQADFIRDVPAFEAMLTEANIVPIKIWLDITKGEQARRLEARVEDPLKHFKTSPLDAEAQKRWHAYSEARDTMLLRSHTPHAPWLIVATDDKKQARLNVMRHLVERLGVHGLSVSTRPVDPAIAFPFEPESLKDGRMAR